MVKTAGYVVQAHNGRFLSRKMRFVRKRNRTRWPNKKNGLERAWVHTLEALKEGGPWTDNAFKLYPAEYDHEKEMTLVLGKPFEFHNFMSSGRCISL